MPNNGPRNDDAGNEGRPAPLQNDFFRAQNSEGAFRNRSFESRAFKDQAESEAFGEPPIVSLCRKENLDGPGLFGMKRNETGVWGGCK